MPEKLTGIATMAAVPAAGGGAVFYLGGREGVFYSADAGASWKHMHRLPVADIASLTYSEKLNRVLVVSRKSTMVYAVDPAEQTWKWLDSGEKLRTLRWGDGRFVGATLYEGVVVSPKDNSAVASAGALQ
jgi:uncharacterized protein YjiK